MNERERAKCASERARGRARASNEDERVHSGLAEEGRALGAEQGRRDVDPERTMPPPVPAISSAQASDAGDLPENCAINLSWAAFISSGPPVSRRRQRAFMNGQQVGSYITTGTRGTWHCA